MKSSHRHPPRAMTRSLVKSMSCLQCNSPSLRIRAVGHRSGVVCARETFCMEYSVLLNLTLSSDRLYDSMAENAPIVSVRQADAATMDMGVGHAGFVKLCRFLDMVPMSQSTYVTHMRAVTCANKLVGWTTHSPPFVASTEKLTHQSLKILSSTW